MSNKTPADVQFVVAPLSQEAAQQLVDVVLGNLKGRSGFKHIISDVRSNDPEIWEEMLQEMRDGMTSQITKLLPSLLVEKV